MCDVLLLDDDWLVRNTLLSLLEAEGYDVHEVATPAEAMHFVEAEGGCRVLVTDIDLGVPGLNGFEVAARVRRLVPGMPVVFISGRDWHLNDRPSAPDERSLAKPFRGNDLIHAVQELMAA